MCFRPFRECCILRRTTNLQACFHLLIKNEESLKCPKYFPMFLVSLHLLWSYWVAKKIFVFPSLPLGCLHLSSVRYYRSWEKHRTQPKCVSAVHAQRTLWITSHFKGSCQNTLVLVHLWKSLTKWGRGSCCTCSGWVVQGADCIWWFQFCVPVAHQLNRDRVTVLHWVSSRTVCDCALGAQACDNEGLGTF